MSAKAKSLASTAARGPHSFEQQSPLSGAIVDEHEPRVVALVNPATRLLRLCAAARALSVSFRCHNLCCRYVEDPHLLHGKKYSLGVYTAFTGVDPLELWLHREMLCLVCTKDFEGGGGAFEPLSHLSNGLLNRKLNPGDVPECPGCAYNATEQVR